MSTLKEARVKAGMTQAEVAKLTGIPLGTLRRWEQGINQPDIGNIIQLADTYCVSCDELLGSAFAASVEYDSGKLTDDERDMLRLYRDCPKAGRAFLRGVARDVADMLRGR